MCEKTLFPPNMGWKAKITFYDVQINSRGARSPLDSIYMGVLVIEK